MAKKASDAGGGRSQAVHRALKRAIIDQALTPGSKLPEDSIGERMGVSRTLVREALVRLSQEGLVELRPNKGAVVARPSLEEGRDLFLTRRRHRHRRGQARAREVQEQGGARLR